MALAATIDTTEAVISYLHNHDDWPSAYEIHGEELPIGWSLTTAVVVSCNGGMDRLDVPLPSERFEFHCYGATTQQARTVADKVHDILHGANRVDVTVTEGTASLAVAQRMLGPYYVREPDTEWPRMVSVYQITFSRWAQS